MTRKNALSTGLGALVLAGAVGCGGMDDSSTSPSSPVAAAPAIDVSVVRGMTEYDYEPAPSLKALASAEPSATLGEVVGWTDGRSLVENDGSGYVDTSYFAVLEIKVAQSYRALAGRSDEDRIYVEVPRGGEVKVDGESPEGTEPVLSTIPELNAAAPQGTPVIVVGREAPTAAEWESATSDSTVRNATAGRPEDVTLLRAHVQGLIFEESTGTFSSGLADDEDQWGWTPSTTSVGDEFDHLVAELDSLKR